MCLGVTAFLPNAWRIYFQLFCPGYPAPSLFSCSITLPETFNTSKYSVICVTYQICFLCKGDHPVWQNLGLFCYSRRTPACSLKEGEKTLLILKSHDYLLACTSPDITKQKQLPPTKKPSRIHLSVNDALNLPLPRKHWLLCWRNSWVFPFISPTPSLIYLFFYL